MKRLLVLLVLGFCAPLFAAEKDDTENIREVLKRMAPGAVPDSIKASPFPGIHEVSFGSQILYLSSDGRYLFTGDMVDLKTQTNLTEERRSVGRVAAMDKAGKNNMIVYPAKGKTKHVISVFTDIDCGYCRKLHAGMKEMNELGIEVRYLAFPRAGAGSPAFEKAVSVWCAKDRRKAMDTAKTGANPEKGTCDNPVAQQLELGQAVGVQGTPSIVLADGQLIPGYLPPQQLFQNLEKSKK